MSKLRGPKPIRNLRQSIEQSNTPASRTAYLEDEVHREALEQLLPQIAAESEQASRPVRQAFHYYRRKLTGRRCSCFVVETSPDGFCPICYGSGYVGGWDLHGTRTEVIDVTTPNLRLVNVDAAFNEGIRPTPFQLVNGSKKGFIEAEIALVRNEKKVQLIQEGIGNKRKGVDAKTFIRSLTEENYVPLNEQSLEARLGESKVMIKVELERANTSLPSIRFNHLFLRYNLIPDITMYGDMNLAEESFELGDLGFTDAFSTLNLFVGPKFDHIRMEDFLVRIQDQKRFKVTRFQRNTVSGILLSTTVMARLLIPGSDSLIKFP